MDTIIIKTDSLNMTEEEFFFFCQENEQLRMERNPNGEIIIMAPTGDWISNRNVHLTTDLEIWNRKMKLGYTFESNAGFTLPNKAIRSPDAAWISKERFEALPQEDAERFGHICPDFVVELKSKSDSVNDLKEKMAEWMDNGCRLGWLINPDEGKIFIYRKKGSVEEKSFDEKISGEDVLPGFELDLSFMKK